MDMCLGSLSCFLYWDSYTQIQWVPIRVFGGAFGHSQAITSHYQALSLSPDVLHTNLRDDYDYDVCQLLSNFTLQLIVGLNMTSYCCLTNSTHCGHNATEEEYEMNKAEGYHCVFVMSTEHAP
jgi:hypothetical protein